MASFVTRITSFLRKSTNPDWGTLERFLAWANGGGASASGMVVNPTTAMQAAAVYSCVKVLSESVGQLPLMVYQRDAAKNTKTEATRDRRYDLLNAAPNEFQTATEWLEMKVAHMNLRGNAFDFKLKTRSGDIVELLPLHPDTVSVKMDAQFVMSYEVTAPDGTRKTLGREDIVHYRGLTLNGYVGISPIGYARESIGLALATEKFGAQLFRNGAKMGGVLTFPTTLSDPAYERLKTSFDAATSGDHAHKTAILEDGGKFEKISMSAEDSQFLETRKYQREEIAGMFRVPAHMIGDLSRSTNNNIEQQSLEFVMYSLMPWLNRIEKRLWLDLFTRDERKTLFPKFVTKELQRGDLRARAEYNQRAILAGYLTRNEARLDDDRNPLPGLDEPLAPVNMTPADMLGQLPTTPPAKP
jgi:HK97 family phage portal protein